MTGRDQFREMAGGYVLDALDPSERRLFEEHLAGCEECRAEVAALAPIPALLSRVEGAEPGVLPASVADIAAGRARSAWTKLDRSRRVWRWVSAAAVAVAAAVVAVAVVAARPDPSSATVLAVADGSPVAGEISIDARTWGTALHIELSGLPQRDRYVAWVVDDSGNWEQAAMWGPTPSGRARLDGAAGIQADEVASIVITDPDRTETLAHADIASTSG